VQPRDIDHGRRQIDTRHQGTAARECLGEEPAAAAHIEHAGAAQASALAHELRAHRVEQMQRAELPLRIPESMRERLELAELGVIGLAR